MYHLMEDVVAWYKLTLEEVLRLVQRKLV